MRMPIVVKPPDRNLVFVEKVAFILVNGIIFEPLRFICVSVKGGLMSDNKVGSERSGLLDHIDSRKHRRYNSGYSLLAVAGLQCIYSLIEWCSGNLFKNKIDHLLNGYTRRKCGLLPPEGQSW